MRIDPQPFPQHDTLARENLCGINMEQDQPLVEFILYQRSDFVCQGTALSTKAIVGHSGIKINPPFLQYSIWKECLKRARIPMGVASVWLQLAAGKEIMLAPRLEQAVMIN